jgi:hypothetical protein
VSYPHSSNSCPLITPPFQVHAVCYGRPARTRVLRTYEGRIQARGFSEPVPQRSCVVYRHVSLHFQWLCRSQAYESFFSEAVPFTSM